MDYLKQACSKLGIDESRVIAHGVNELEACFNLVVDNGIAGCPKHKIPLSELDKALDTVVVTALDVAIELQANDDEAFPGMMTTKELKNLAKKRGLAGYGRMSKAKLIEALS